MSSGTASSQLLPFDSCLGVSPKSEPSNRGAIPQSSTASFQTWHFCVNRRCQGGDGGLTLRKNSFKKQHEALTNGVFVSHRDPSSSARLRFTGSCAVADFGLSTRCWHIRGFSEEGAESVFEDSVCPFSVKASKHIKKDCLGTLIRCVDDGA